MIGNATDLSLFLVDVEDNVVIPAARDVIVRVNVRTGNADLAWLAERGITALAMTSQGHVAASWSEKIIVYNINGIQIKRYRIPQLMELVPKETVPLPDGEPVTL
jgi:hypothetical protein